MNLYKYLQANADPKSKPFEAGWHILALPDFAERLFRSACNSLIGELFVM
jgi:hypothetical protein